MTGSIPAPRRTSAIAVLLAVSSGLAFAGRSAAELVILTDGSVLKVAGYEVEADRAVLSYPEGGRITLALLRIERIVDDEIEPDAAPETERFEEPDRHLGVRFVEGQPRPDGPYSELIFAAAEKHGLNPALVAAVARAESAFDPRAVSYKGARGLMQLMPATGERFGLRPSELFEPIKNLDAGTRYLRWLADRFADDLPKMLAGYNAGEGTVDRYRGVPPYRETLTYIARVYGFLGVPTSSSTSTASTVGR